MDMVCVLSATLITSAAILSFMLNGDTDNYETQMTCTHGWGSYQDAAFLPSSTTSYIIE